MGKNLKKYTLFFILVGWLLPRISPTQEPIQAPCFELRILSWNIYMLPAVSFVCSGQNTRAALIGDLLAESSYDVIIFQEAFTRESRKRIWENLKDRFPHQVLPLSQGGLLQANNGIWILSRWPMTFIDSFPFERCVLPDLLASKGAALVEIEKDGRSFQILGTHLQSGTSTKRDSIRLYEARRIFRLLLRPHQTKNVPQFLCGDFNTDNLQTIVPMMAILQATNTPYVGGDTYTWPAQDFKGRKKFLDFIWLRDNGNPPARIERSVKKFRTPWMLKKKERMDLSDHYAIECVAIW